ncbi:hypothetical protein NOVO_03760 [Rickettsiales bacterium Ac37b]|nr:hypothetical protein NOVO_03760 [Rickettsiales bacterium Ac37b]
MSNMIEKTNNKTNSIVSRIEHSADRIIDGFKNKIDTIEDAIMKIFEEFHNFKTEMVFPKLGHDIGQCIADLTDSASTAFNRLTKDFNTLDKDLHNPDIRVGAVITDIFNVITDLRSGVKDLSSTFRHDVKTVLSDIDGIGLEIPILGDNSFKIEL